MFDFFLFFFVIIEYSEESLKKMEWVIWEVRTHTKCRKMQLFPPRPTISNQKLPTTHTKTPLHWKTIKRNSWDKIELIIVNFQDQIRLSNYACTGYCLPITYQRYGVFLFGCVMCVIKHTIVYIYRSANFLVWGLCAPLPSCLSTGFQSST